MNKEPERNNSMDEEMPAGCPACETLKLVVGQLPRPGLEQRVLARLREQPVQAEAVWWRLRSVWVGGAAMVTVLAAGWIGMLHSGAPGNKPATGASVQSTPAAERGPGSFGTAGSMRVPPTRKPLYVPEAPRRSSATTQAVDSPAAKAGKKKNAAPVKKSTAGGTEAQPR